MSEVVILRDHPLLALFTVVVRPLDLNRGQCREQLLVPILDKLCSVTLTALRARPTVAPTVRIEQLL